MQTGILHRTALAAMFVSELLGQHAAPKQESIIDETMRMSDSQAIAYFNWRMEHGLKPDERDRLKVLINGRAALVLPDQAATTEEHGGSELIGASDRG